MPLEMWNQAGVGGRTGTHTPDRTSVHRGLEGVVQEQPVQGLCGRSGCCQVRLGLAWPKTGQNYHPGPMQLSGFIQVISPSSASRTPQAGSHDDHTLNHTQSWCHWCHSPPSSTSFPLTFLGLSHSRLVQRGADVIQLARKHRLEKTHTVNLTGN